MPTLFVHGITVRRARFEKLLKDVQQGFKKQRADAVVDGFYWGDMASSLRYDGASIPEFITGRRAFDERIAAVSDENQLTTLLLDDPLLELRLVRDPEDFNPAGLGFEPLPDGVAERNERLEAARGRLATAVAADRPLAGAAGATISELQAQQLVAECFEAAGRANRALDVATLIDPLCRAITASIYRLVEGDAPKLDQQFQWLAAEERIQALVEAALGGQKSWIGDKWSEFTGGVASNAVTFAMRHGLRKRIMQSSALFIGDVLAYMAKRDQVQAALEQTIAESLARQPGPLTLVGHSLGGILCFDYCLKTNKNVEHLMTVGSQVGLFAELGAFPALTVGPEKKLATPGVVQHWINVYDPNDILSFLAAPVLSGVTDLEYDTKTPFPVAHSEYWNQPQLYASLLP